MAADMRATAQQSAAERRLQATLQALVLAALARLLDRLAEMIALWQSGQLPPPTPRRRTPHPPLHPSPLDRTAPCHGPRHAARPPPIGHPQCTPAPQPHACAVSPARAHHAADPAAHPAHTAPKPAPMPRAQPPPAAKFGAEHTPPSHALIVPISAQKSTPRPFDPRPARAKLAPTRIEETPMPKMTGGDAIVDSLLRHGVDTVFGLPGVQVYGLFDAFARNANRLNLINARHEQTTAYMAMGYAASTGKPGVFSVVPGPGVLNTTAALATGWGINAPMLCITGQVPSPMIGRLRGQLHELPDQLATLKTLLKFAERIEHPTEAPQVMARAFQAMTSGRPGPVAVEVPWDMFPLATEVTPMDPLARLPNPTPDPEKIAALAKLVDGAKMPMFWVGGGAAHAAPEILALAERLGAPVVSFRTGRGVLDSRHPLSLNVHEAGRLWPQVDLLIGIGTRLDAPTSRWPRQPGRSFARIDIDPAEHRRQAVDHPIVADSADGARALAAAVARNTDPDRAAAIAAAKAESAEFLTRVQPQMSMLAAIRAAMPDDGILVDEMTQVGYVSWIGYPVYQPRGLVTSGFSGTLGYGFPTALGVKVANPDRAVVSITGDGGFLFGGTDLATATRYGINLVTVLFNNEAYGNVLRDQRRLFDGRDAGSKLTNPDFQTFAKSFGVAAWKVETPEALQAALREALASGAPALIEVVSDITKDYLPFELFVPQKS
jgi:acetolactate synthase-1/2/3 large subunit